MAQNRWIKLSFQNSFSATALKNNFTSKFIVGGHISDEIKADNPQNKFNALGGEFEQKIEYFEGNILKKMGRYWLDHFYF